MVVLLLLLLFPLLGAGGNGCGNGCHEGVVVMALTKCGSCGCCCCGGGGDDS